jgi:hypothetical protein
MCRVASLVTGLGILAAAAFPPTGDFSDVLGADITGDRRSLSLSVSGQARGAPSEDQVVRVYIRGRASAWRRAPRLPQALAPGGHVSLAQATGRPCVGYESLPRGRVLVCLRRGRWRSLGSVGLPRSARLLELFRSRGGFTAALDARGAVVVLRLRDGRWRRLGKALPRHGAIAAVDEPSGGGAVDVALVDLARGERVVWTLANSAWRRHVPLRGPGGGPMPGGPVRFGGRIYLPVNDATVEPWAFSVQVLERESWRALGAPLNRSAGHAQGALRAGGGSLWATWQEHDQRDDGLFDTHMYVQRIAPTPTTASEVWAGTTVGPGSIETVQAAGRRWVLYTPAAKGRRALTVAVEPLR